MPGVLLEPCNFSVTVARSGSPIGASFTQEGNVVRVSTVAVGSPASIAGLFPRLTITHVNGNEVISTDDVEKAPPGDILLRVTADSSGLLPGRVTYWSKEKQFGNISPTQPIFAQPGLLSPTSAVFYGVIRCNAASFNGKACSLAVGQHVEFEANYNGRFFGITTIQGVGGAAMVDAVSKKPMPRAGADIAELMKSSKSVCLLHMIGRCPSLTCSSEHLLPELPVTPANEVLVKVGPSKLDLLQQKWNDAKGPNVLVNAWQLRNDSLELRFRATEYNMTRAKGRAPDMVDGFHGTEENNVLSIAQTGFDPLKRSKQIFGKGEYFAKDPNVSIYYCRGSAFVFLCKLILGEADDHEWQPDHKYYIVKQREGNIQALPVYLLQYTHTTASSPLSCVLEKLQNDEERAAATLQKMGMKQRGGQIPEKGRIIAGMVAQETRHLWLGWLKPGGSDEEVESDVKEFLVGHQVKMLKPERNAARVGAFVELEAPVNQLQLAELNTRLYLGEHTITVDDQQRNNPFMSSKPCPRLLGPSKYCRGWNIRHGDWTEACCFRHNKKSFVNFGARVTYEAVPLRSAKYEELASEMRSAGITDIKQIKRVVNKSQERNYESRRAFLNEKHGFVVEKELWHGTTCSVVDDTLRLGLQCPSDCKASEKCPVSGGKGLTTTLCGADCTHCTAKHVWAKCHMFGLGIYLSDSVEKSHRYVTPAKGVYSLMRCRVNLGNPYLIEARLKTGCSMHDIIRCVDPSPYVDPLKKVEWDTLKSHDSYYVKGLKDRATKGLSVINNEFVIFHPLQALPLYIVEYVP